MRLGQRVRECRLAAGLRQQELARRAGVSQTTISDLERGRNASSADLPQIARALGVTAEELVYGAASAPPMAGADAELLSLWSQITPAQQADQLARLRGLVRNNREIAKHLSRLGLDEAVPDREVAKHLPPAPRRRSVK